MSISTSEQLWSQRGLIVTVEDAEGVPRTVRIASPFARVGSDPRAELVLAGAEILPCHLYLHATDEGIYCLGLGNQAPTGWLTPKLRIEIGNYRIKAGFDDDGPPPRKLDHDPRAKDSVGGSTPRLRLRLTGDKRHAFETSLRRRLTIVGRQAPSTLCIHHPTISRTHAAIFWDGRSLWIVDLLSANGIRRDGEPLKVGSLAVSQRLAVGDVRCRFLGSTDHEPSASERATDEQRVAELRATLGEQIASLTAAREAAEQRAAQHERELAEAKQQLAALQDNQAEWQLSTDERLTALRESLAQELASAVAARDLAETAVTERERALAESEENRRRVQDELAEAKQQLSVLQENQAESQRSGDDRLAALRESLAQELTSAVAARDLAETAVTERERALAEAGEKLGRAQEELMATQRELVASVDGHVRLATAAQERIAALQAEADERLAAIQTSHERELTAATEARDVARQALAENQAELAGAQKARVQLEAELAEARLELAAAAASNAELEELSLPEPAAPATPERTPSPSFNPRQQLAPSAPASEPDWVLDDRVIGRLLDFRAKQRDVGRRRKVLWGVAACLAIVVLGAAAAAGRAWTVRQQPNDPSAGNDSLMREVFAEPDLR